MASTNHTAHYGLSQYLADDKPSYLTDYNADMLAIDNAIWGASQKAEAAAGSVVPVSNTAQNALTTAQNAKEIAENAQGIAANAQTQANTAITTAGQALAAATADAFHGFRLTTGTDPNMKLAVVFSQNFLSITGQVYTTEQHEGGVLWSKTFTEGQAYPANVPDFSDTYEVGIMSSQDNSFVGRATLRFAWVNASKTLTITSVNGFSANNVTELFNITYGKNDIS